MLMRLLLVEVNLSTLTCCGYYQIVDIGVSLWMLLTGRRTPNSINVLFQYSDIQLI